MSEHLSDYRLDVLAEGEGAADAHLDACASCRGRLEAFRAARARSTAQPRFSAIRDGLEPPRRNGWLLPFTAFAAAAGVALALAPHVARPPPQQRLKGGAELQVVALQPEGPHLHPGQRVALSVGAAGHRYALVFGRDEHGQLSQIWPVSSDRSGVVPAAPGRLSPAFEVTPGALHLVALFSDAPLVGTDVLHAWGVARSDEPPPIAGEAARARAELDVEGTR